MNSKASWSERQHAILNELMTKAVITSDLEYARKSVESLLKKLKDVPQNLSNFYNAITSGGETETGCVPISRTLDGRLQVCGRKGFPHMMFSRIFRWPDLQRGELKHKSLCLCPFDFKLENVCVNPYHYERITSSYTQSELGEVSKSRIKTETVPFVSPMLMPPPHIPNLNFQQFFPPISPYFVRPQNYCYFPNQSPHLRNPIYSTLYNKLTNLINTYESPWCKVSYFEYSSQFGDQMEFPVEIDKFVVDGYADVTNHARFSVGAIQNDNRDAKSARSRKFIGDGFEVIKKSLQSVIMFNNADRPLFVKGFLLEYYDEVVKLFPKTSIEIFNITKLFELIASSFISGGEPYSLERLRNESYEVVISFNKGWGPDYKRSDVSDSPCWMKIEFGIGMKLVEEMFESLNLGIDH